MQQFTLPEFNSKFADNDTVVIPHMVPFAGLMLVFLITVFALTLQFNRQEAVWQEAGLNQLAHDLVYHSGQLARQQSQLQATIEEGPLPTSSILNRYRSQVETQLEQLALPTLSGDLQQQALQPAVELIEQYRHSWDSLQLTLNLFLAYPEDAQLHRQLHTEFQAMDQTLAALGANRPTTVRHPAARLGAIVASGQSPANGRNNGFCSSSS